MIAYFDTVPAGAISREIDGNLYARTDAALERAPYGVTVTRTGRPRMLRVAEDQATRRDGIARVLVGRAGDAIACTVNLPYGIECEMSAA